MSERKNIERLFQEKFKDFEVAPDPQAWENIASKLEKKENKKRIFPFWLKASGIAASLVLGYFAIDTDTDGAHSNSIENNTEKVTSSESSEKVNQQSTTAEEKQNSSSIVTTNNAILNNTNQEKAVVANEVKPINRENSEANESNSDYSALPNKKAKENTPVHLQSNPTNAVAVHTNKHKKSSSTSALSEEEKTTVISPSYNTTQSQSVAQNNPTVNHKASLKNEVLNKENGSFDNSDKTTQSQSVAQNNPTVNHKASLKNEVLNKENGSFDNSDKTTQSQSVAQNNPTVNHKASLKNEVLNKENPSLDNSNKEEKSQSVVLNTNASDVKSAVNLTENRNPIDSFSDHTNQKSTIANATNQSVNPLALTAKDSVAVALEENPLEKMLKEKELPKKEEKVLAENNPKWKIKPNVAPLYMNSPEGSPIDAQFADNSKKFENKMSVGLGIDYALSSKVSLRTGINQFDLGYNTNDIAFYADLNSKGPKQNSIKTINLRPDAKSMVIEDRKTSSSQELAVQNKENGYINQRMGYVEVPVEISYKLLDKRFGVQFITGISTLFLNDNQISVVSSGLTTVLGEANNLNKVHFSTNIGLGFKYTFWKSFEANFEPTFKYQINTFNDNSGGFKPYLIGLYSGLSFKF